MAQAAAAGARAAEGNATASGNYSSLDGLSALMLLGEQQQQEGADAGGAAARAADARASAVEAALSAARKSMRDLSDRLATATRNSDKQGEALRHVSGPRPARH